MAPGNGTGLCCLARPNFSMDDNDEVYSVLPRPSLATSTCTAVIASRPYGLKVLLKPSALSVSYDACLFFPSRQCGRDVSGCRMIYLEKQNPAYITRLMQLHNAGNLDITSQCWHLFKTTIIKSILRERSTSPYSIHILGP